MPTTPDAGRTPTQSPDEKGGKPRAPDSHRADPNAPPRSEGGVKVNRDPLAKGSVRPNPSGDLP